MSYYSILFICAGILIFFVFFLGFLLLMRLLNYRENSKLAQAGFTTAQKPRRNRGLLVWGWLITILASLAIPILWFFGHSILTQSQYYPLGLGPWMLLGFFPLFFGLCLLLVYVILAERYVPQKSQANPAQDVTGNNLTD